MFSFDSKHQSCIVYIDINKQCTQAMCWTNSAWVPLQDPNIKKNLHDVKVGVKAKMYAGIQYIVT